MGKRNNNYFVFGFVAMLLLLATNAKAQQVENEVQTRMDFSLSYKPAKKIKLKFTPELRLDESFSVDKFLLEGAVQYQPIKLITVEANYRYYINPRNTKATEYYNKFALSATAEKKIERFKTAFRLRYSNDADDETTNKEFLRYKGLVEYNIKKCKATPYFAAEAFQLLDGNGLYKMRYTAGVDYKLFKKNDAGISYKFDYYNQEYMNRHIVSIGYKFKF